ncbi:MAG: toxin-antitoxin system YwqK family antitoxin [Bacteroidales bacterium]
MKKLILPIILFFTLVNTLAAQEVILKKERYVTRENGKTYTGIFKEYDSDKKLISATGIKNGLLEDSTIIYYQSGTIKEIRSYREGLKNGIWTTWNESGKKTAEASFKNGKKDGAWYVWDDKGVKRYEMYYEKGDKKGLWIIRDENGQVTSREEFK